MLTDTKKEIRFIDSHYNTLFHIADGECIEMTRGKEVIINPCFYVDEYHTRVGYNTFHICEFAEVMQRNKTSYCKEPKIQAEEAAWKVGTKRYLILQTCDDGYDYTIFDENLKEIDGGQLDMPELSMNEARNEILSSYELFKYPLYPRDYDEIVELAEI